LIEENAKILRIEIRLNILTHPVHALPKIDIHKILDILLDKINSGINFCQVLRRINLCQDSPSLTSGNQKKIGNIPSFVRRASLVISILNNRFIPAIFRRVLLKKIDLAIDWIIKYFIILFTDDLEFMSIKGIKAIILISKLNQIWNQDSADKAVKVLKARIIKNKRFI